MEKDIVSMELQLPVKKNQSILIIKLGFFHQLLSDKAVTWRMAYWLIEKNSDIEILPLCEYIVKFKDFFSTFHIFINYLEAEGVYLSQSFFNKPIRQTLSDTPCMPKIYISKQTQPNLISF